MNVRFLPRSTPRRLFKVKDVQAMVRAGILPDDERVELIHGELVPMSAKGIRHEILKAALNRRWQRVCPEHVQIIQETTFYLSDDTYLEPDFVAYPNEVGTGGIKGENVLLVAEVADTSKRYDRGRKARLYAEFGVREYWAIDAVRMTTRVFAKPAAEGYANEKDVTASQMLTPLFAPKELALRLDALKLV